MLEFGLTESAVETSSELLSTDLQVTSDSEAFLEVKYVSNQTNKNPALPEVLQHMHNDTPTAEYITNEEPESPTIPRDVPVNNGSDSDDVPQSHTKEHTQHRSKMHEHAKVHRSLSGHCDNLNRNTNSILPVPVGTELENHTDSFNVITHVLDSQIDSETSEELLYTKEVSPLKNMDKIVQIEAVQTGKTLPNDAEKIQEYSEKINLASSPDNSFLDDYFDPKTPTKEVNMPSVLKRSESFEDLDSPESICRIDREDCFSWEEDRALLTIDPDPDSKDSSGEEKAITSKDNSDVMTVNVSKPEAVPSGKDSVDFTRETYQKGHKETSPGRMGDKAAALKSKLSSAFGNLHKERSKVKGNNVLEPQEVREEPMLQQDQYGFPLAIFAQVYYIFFLCK